jgi:hypothetical protein
MTVVRSCLQLRRKGVIQMPCGYPAKYLLSFSPNMELPDDGCIHYQGSLVTDATYIYVLFCQQVTGVSLSALV